MKIFLVGNKGPMGPILESLLKRSDIQIVGLLTKEVSLKRKIKDSIKSSLAFFNITLGNSFELKDLYEDFPNPIRIAKKNKIPIYSSKVLKTSVFKSALISLKPELIIMAGFHKLIPDSLLDIPKRGFINFHPSLLPKYRGGTPNRWVLFNDEKESGVTAHFVDKSFDTGKIILQDKFPIEDDDNLGDLETKSALLMANLSNEIITRSLKAPLASLPQDNSISSYDKSFKGVHVKLNPNYSFKETNNQLRAIQPKSGISFDFQNLSFCIWKIKEMNIDLKTDESLFILNGCLVFKLSDCFIALEEFLFKGKVVNSNQIIEHYKLRERLKNLS